MINNPTAQTELYKPIRHINAMVALHNGATLLNTFTQADALKSFEVSRVGAGRFFGYGVCARLNVKLIDPNRSINVSAGNTIVITLIAGSSAVTPYPDFIVTEVNRDENTNALSVTAYDVLYFAQARTVDELQAVTPYTLGQYAAYIAAVLGLDIELDTAAAAQWALSYADGANLDGTETLREVLDDIAEASGTVYSILRRATGGGTMAETLTFRRLRDLGRAAGKNLLDPRIIADHYGMTVTQDGTITGQVPNYSRIVIFESASPVTVSWESTGKTIGFFLYAEDGARAAIYPWNSGMAQGSRSNVYKVETLVGSANVDGTTKVQIEYGDTATTYEPYREYYAITKDEYITASVKTNRRLAGIASVTELGDNVTAELEETGTIEYLRDNAFLSLRTDTGAILQALLDDLGGQTIAQFNTDWRGNYLLEPCDPVGITTKDGATARAFFLGDTTEYNGAYRQKSGWEYEDSEETESNPATLVDVLNLTRARVDKVNREIDITAAQGDALAQDVAALHINTTSISASVEQVQKEQEQSNATTAEALADLRAQVNATMTAEQVQLTVAQEIAQGTTKVQTETGYTFDASGLRIARTGSDVETAVTDDGLHIYRAGSEVLRADNEGVKAEDLHATTYLIIGNNSRFEDYEKDGNQYTACFWIGQTSI